MVTNRKIYKLIASTIIMARNRDLVSLIKDDLDRDETALLHGTSVEAALSLLRNGSLRPEAPFSDCPDIYSPKDHLFFVPYPPGLKGHELYDRYKHLKWGDDVAEQAISYARLNAHSHYIVSNVGFWPEYLLEYDLTNPYLGGYQEGAKNFESELNKRGFPSGSAVKILKKASERKGVVLGLSKDILELPIEPDKDDPEQAIQLYAPDGLDGKYINAIIPLGKVDRQELEKFRS